ncbi:MAG: POTRA domain-containing protein, partial [Bdellovibrionota bacterium]
PQIIYNPERTQAKLTYTIENPIRFEFRLEGNKRMSDGTLIESLESERLAGATASPAPDMADRLRRLYQNEGYANAEVTYTEEINDDLHRQLIRFKIIENPRVKIDRIEVTGNVSRPEAFYAGFIKSSSSDLIGSGYYNRKDVDEGSKLLITELQNQGFLRAKIQSQRAEYSKDKSSVVISLNIDEGPLTQVRQIRFEGANSFPRTKLLELLKIKQNAALSLKDLEDSLDILKEFYRSEGFLEMRLMNENERNRIVTYNETNTQATIEFEIYEGPKVIVASIELKNNTFTKDYVITRELTFKKDDVLTPLKISESITRLQTLGLFSRVTIRTLEEGTNSANRTVIIEVTEANPGILNIGVGVNNEQQLTFRGYLGLAYRNLNGTGRGAVFRVDPKYSTDPAISYVEHRIAMSYLEPFVFGDRNRGRVNIVRDLSFASFNAGGDALIQEENSLGLLLEKDLSKHLKLTYTVYNFANQLQFNRRTKEIIETQNIAKTGPLVEIDYRDEVFFPSKGTYSFINFEYSDPALGSSQDREITIHFVKSTASFTHYQSIAKRRDFVWANSIRGGYLANISNQGNGGVPAQESFFLGGRSTIRGFDSSDLDRFPNYIDLGVERGLTKFRMTSDSQFYLVKSEVRFPIYKNFFIGPLGGVIFYDGGAVLLSQSTVTLPDPYRHSAGIGLRIATPVGPLNLEYGWKLDRRKYGELEEAAGAFHFSIGSF